MNCGGDASGLELGVTGSETSRIASGRDRSLARQLGSAREPKEPVLERIISGCEEECCLGFDRGKFSQADSDTAKDANSAVCSRRPEDEY